MATSEEGTGRSLEANRDGRKLVVMGQGYVGLPLAVRAVEVGFDVVGFDVDKNKISGLVTGVSHVDDVDDATIRSMLESSRYLPTESAAHLLDFDIAVITVPTPLRDGTPDVSYIVEAVDLLGSFLRPGALVILESTTYPGTTEEIVCHGLETASGLRAGVEFQVGYSPERIDPGNERWDFTTTPKVVSGIDAVSTAAVADFYRQLVDTVVPAAGTKEAEFAKLLENTFRHVNIALMNELAMSAGALGVDIWDVIDVAKTKPFGFMPFYPGPGVGGHCLPIDPSYLSWQAERVLGHKIRFIELANDVNHEMPVHVVERLQDGLNRRRKPVNGSRVLVLGVAYKKNIRDTRESPAVPLIRKLLDLGAVVEVHDPIVEDFELDDHVARVALDPSRLAEVDAVVVVTDHDAFDYDTIAGHADFVLDARRRFAPDAYGDKIESI